MRGRRVVALLATAATVSALGMLAPDQAPPAAAATGAADESRDFRFPGADLTRVSRTTYVAYGASLRNGNRLPYTRVEWRDGTFQRRARIDGNAWADVRFPDNYWAERGSKLWTPAVLKRRDGDGQVRYYLFYTARKRADTERCIGVATSRRWDGGFRPAARPLLCARTAWAIDADISQGDGGTWLTLRNGDWTHDRVTGLGVGRLRFDGRGHVSLDAPVKLLDNEHLEWTFHDSPRHLVKTIENPNAVWMNERWYLFYSGNNWDKNRYATGVAFCGAELDDGPCTPVAEPEAYFAFKPDPDGPARFRPGLPAHLRKKTLPGNKRGPGAFDAFQAPNGTWWASWNYITDASPLDEPVRQSRIAPLVRSGNGLGVEFVVTWR